eukprot:3102068-Amphidinium_carterae.1
MPPTATGIFEEKRGVAGRESLWHELAQKDHNPASKPHYCRSQPPRNTQILKRQTPRLRPVRTVLHSPDSAKFARDMQ